MDTNLLIGVLKRLLLEDGASITRFSEVNNTVVCSLCPPDHEISINPEEYEHLRMFMSDVSQGEVTYFGIKHDD